MNIRTLVGAVALLLCCSVVIADSTSTVADFGEGSVSSDSNTNNISNSGSSLNENEPASTSPTDSPPTSLSETTTTSSTPNPPSISSRTSDSDAPSIFTSSSPQLTSPPQATASSSTETSRRPPPRLTTADELSTTTTSLQTNEVDESMTSESSTNPRPSTISKTPVTSTVTLADASSTTLETSEKVTNNMGSTDESGIRSEEPTTRNSSKYSFQNETDTLGGTFNFPENDNLTTTLTSEDTSGISTDVTESHSVCNMAHGGFDQTSETLRHYYLITVILVLVMNFGFCVVTVFCVHRITKHYNTRSWDPPPIRYGSVDYGISMGRRNMGLDLTPETHVGIPPPPRETHERSDSIPIMITNADGWCVPYHDEVHAKSPTNLDEDNNQQMSTISEELSSSSPVEMRRHSDTGL
ncbi:hypothetical protein FHG87_003826 [Trinorchestia longiramus]|nr:hypothetical protein FHG87_003826 [Trinorchestia longiramus]